MKEKEFKKTIKNLTKQIAEEIENESLRIFRSKRIEVKKYENEGYALAKVVICGVLHELSYGYLPMTKEFRKDAQSLRKF